MTAIKRVRAIPTESERTDKELSKIANLGWATAEQLHSQFDPHLTRRLAQELYSFSRNYHDSIPFDLAYQRFIERRHYRQTCPPEAIKHGVSRKEGWCAYDITSTAELIANELGQPQHEEARVEDTQGSKNGARATSQGAEKPRSDHAQVTQEEQEQDESLAEVTKRAKLQDTPPSEEEEIEEEHSIEQGRHQERALSDRNSGIEGDTDIPDFDNEAGTRQEGNSFDDIGFGGGSFDDEDDEDDDSNNNGTFFSKQNHPTDIENHQQSLLDGFKLSTAAFHLLGKPHNLDQANLSSSMALSHNEPPVQFIAQDIMLQLSAPVQRVIAELEKCKDECALEASRLTAAVAAYHEQYLQHAITANAIKEMESHLDWINENVSTEGVREASEQKHQEMEEKSETQAAEVKSKMAEHQSALERYTIAVIKEKTLQKTLTAAKIKYNKKVDEAVEEFKRQNERALFGPGSS
jgi:hypothetical protein